MASMQGKVVAITGGASGIGLATAKVLFSLGATLAIADISAENLKSAESELSQKHRSTTAAEQQISTTILNVSKATEINAWIDAVVERHGKLDCACNIAGIGQPAIELRDSDDNLWEKVMAVNGKGVFMCMRKELQVMENGASIVNVSSSAGIKGSPMIGIYSAAKHAVVGLTKTAAREEGKRGIRINAVAPGVIDTPLVHEGLSFLQPIIDQSAIKRPADPLEVGRAIAFLLSDDASFVTGTVMPVDAGFVA